MIKVTIESLSFSVLRSRIVRCLKACSFCFGFFVFFRHKFFLTISFYRPVGFLLLTALRKVQVSSRVNEKSSGETKRGDNLP